MLDIQTIFGGQFAVEMEWISENSWGITVLLLVIVFIIGDSVSFPLGIVRRLSGIVGNVGSQPLQQNVGVPKGEYGVLPALRCPDCDSMDIIKEKGKFRCNGCGKISGKHGWIINGKIVKLFK